MRSLAQRTSDDGGKLQFDDLAPGIYRLYASRGRSAAGSEATVVAGGVSQFTLAVEGDVRLRVSVIDEARQPQPGADVWCYDAYVYDGERERCLGRTDRAGEFVFRGLPLYSVWARQSGRQPSPTHDLPQGRPDDTPREEIVVQLVIGAAGCSVLGSVVDPHGQPVPAARVFVACDDVITPVSKRMALRVTTDAAGKFACDEVPAGERSIVADAPGFAAAIARITTSPTEPVTTNLALQIGATLSGRVADDAGRPMAGVKVTAGARSVVWGVNTSWSSERTTNTDVEGRYRLEAICPGAIEARVHVEPEAVREFQFVDGQQQTWDVTKEASRCLVGVVVDSQDKPLAGWRVRPVSEPKPGMRRGRPGGPGQEARTDAAGRFRLEAMEDIDHRVFVFAPVVVGQSGRGAASMVPRVVLDAVRPSPTELVVRIDAAAMASGWIEGSIAMPEGMQAKTTLSLYAKVLSGGGFSVPQERLEPGVTTFRLGPLPAGEYDLLCDIEGRGRLAQRHLRLSPDETLRLPPFAADAQRPLQLVLRHADGRPAIGADVKLRSGLDRCRETGPGRYESQPVDVGQYEAIVRGPDFALCTFAIEFTGQTEPFERTVPAGTAVQLCLKPTTPRDRWIGAMQVWIHDAEGVEVVRDMIQVDGKQDFVWPIGLLPGTYTVKVSVFGDGSATATLQVAGTPLRVDLPLAK